MQDKSDDSRCTLLSLRAVPYNSLLVSNNQIAAHIFFYPDSTNSCIMQTMHKRTVIYLNLSSQADGEVCRVLVACVEVVAGCIHV